MIDVSPPFCSWSRCLILALVTFSVYVFSLPGKFVYDDVAVTVVENPALRGEASLAEVLTWDRPLREFTYMLDHAVWGYRPVGYHLQNLFWHGANVLLLFGFFCRIGLSLNRSFCVALLFAVHPALTESVAWISGRKELLCLFFELSACLLFVVSVMSEQPSSSSRTWAYIGSNVACLLALLSKQVAVVLPFLLLLSCWFHARMRGTEFKASRVLPVLIVPALLQLLFLFYSYRIVEQLEIVGDRGTFYDPSAREVAYTFLSALLTPLATQLKSLWLFIWPMDLTVEQAFPPVTSWLDIRWAVGAGLIVALWRLGGKTRRLEPAILFGIAWFWITWSPVSGAVPVSYLFADRYLYIPYAGLCAAAVCGGEWFWKYALNRKLKTVGAFGLVNTDPLSKKKSLSGKFRLEWKTVVFILVIVFFSLRTVARTWDWRDEISLWESAVRARPAYAKVHFNLADSYRDAGRMEEAFREWKEALRLNPNYPQVWVNMGNAEDQRNRPAEAEACYRKALELLPTYGTAHYNLAALYESQNKMDLALEHYTLAANYLYGKRTTARRKALAHYHVAKILFDRGDQPAASLHLQHAQSLAPQYAPIYLLQGLLDRNEPELARQAFQTAIRLDLRYADAYYNLGVLEWQWGNVEAAEVHWRAALKLKPSLEALVNKAKSAGAGIPRK